MVDNTGVIYDTICKMIADIINDYQLIYPLNLEKLAELLGWQLKYYDESSDKIEASEDGFSFFDELLYTQVLYINKDQDERRIKFTIGHEIGHHMLSQLFNEFQVTQDEDKEICANYFAGYLLAPLPLLMYYRCVDFYKIADYMQISQEAARCSLNRLYKRIKYGPEELQSFERHIIMSQNGGIDVPNYDDFCTQRIKFPSVYEEHFKMTIPRVTSKNNYPTFDYSDFPIVPPKGIIPFSKRNDIPQKNRQDYYLCFYCEDYEFEKIYKTPTRYEKTFREFAGFIGFDFSTWTNISLAEQKHRIYKNLSLSWYYAHIRNFIPNVRYGLEPTRDEFLETIPKRSLVAVGTHGCIKTKEEKQRWREELWLIINKIHPRGIVVYGPHPNDVFDQLQNLGTEFYYYEPWRPPLHRRRKHRRSRNEY